MIPQTLLYDIDPSEIIELLRSHFKDSFEVVVWLHRQIQAVPFFFSRLKSSRRHAASRGSSRNKQQLVAHTVLPKQHQQPYNRCIVCSVMNVILSNHTSLIQWFYRYFVGLKNSWARLSMNILHSTHYYLATLNERIKLKKKWMQCLLQNMLILLCEERSWWHSVGTGICTALWKWAKVSLRN